MSGLLILIALAAGVAALIQLVRLNEVASKVRGTNSEEDITTGENNAMAYSWLVFMVLFFGFTIWLMWEFGYGGLGPAAAEHGVETDWLLRLNYWIILPVFFFVNALLFWFAFKYRYNKNRKAVHFSHSNKLELIWTVVPSIVLAVIIIMGLRTWINIMFTAPEEGNPQVVEVYAYQFGWNFRLSGENNKLGKADYKLVCGPIQFLNEDGEMDIIQGNPLGVVNKNFILAKYAEIDTMLNQIDTQLEGMKGANGMYWESDETVQSMLTKKENLIIQKQRIKAGLEIPLAEDTMANVGDDDVFLSDELHLIVNKPVTFKFRSKDVIHSALFPHFRAQMNCVPGQVTTFTVTPIYTTKEMREIPEVKAHYKEINKIHNERLRSLGEEEEDVDMNFILLCNKICGASHSNMQKNIIVEEEFEYALWFECKDADAFKAALANLGPNQTINDIPMDIWPKEPKFTVTGSAAVYNGEKSFQAGEAPMNFAVSNLIKLNKLGQASIEQQQILVNLGHLDKVDATQEEIIDAATVTDSTDTVPMTGTH